MPFKSEAQRRYLHAQHPEMAQRWEKEAKRKKENPISKGIPKGAPSLSDAKTPYTLKRVLAHQQGRAASRDDNPFRRLRKIEQGKKTKRGIQKNYTPIFKSADPDFNYEAAQKAFDLVMKMDDDSAEMFVRLVASDVTEMTIEKNLRSVQKRVDEIISKRVEAVRKSMIHKAAEDSEEALPYARAFAEISKATPYDYGYVWRESDFRRDPTTGQFRTKVKTRQTKPINDRLAGQIGVPSSKDKRSNGLSNKRLAAYQDQYRQVAHFLAAVDQSSPNPGDVGVMLRMKNRKTGEEYSVENPGTRMPGKNVWNPKDEDIVGVEARPKTLTAGGAYFGLATTLGASPSRRQTQMAGNINQLDRQMGTFSDQWTQEADAKNTNARTYRRIQAGSELASSVAPPGSKIQMAAKFGEFVGSHGAEAEKVIGPSARKTAYRYRGTEKTPDPDLVNAYAHAVNQSKLQTQIGSRDLAPVQMAAQRTQAQRRTPKFEELGEGRAVVLDYFEGSRQFDGARRIPRQGLYNLQLASGNTPPSEGVIINSKGQIVSQAVGYGDDHYLPFNLKNLKGLKGGEYIRTRSVGGPTSEDIYTGLVSGARQVTVVSRSGRFTVTFEDDFRGGRRHNDKARRMVRRYEQILDAVQSEQVDRKNVDPEIRSAIQHEVSEQMRGYGASSTEIKREVNRRVEEFKQTPELSEDDENLARLIASQRAMGSQGRDADDFMAEAMNKIAEEKEYKFRLNGAGYAAGLEALREQFPYYITVKSTPKREERFEREMDRGYVEPGRNRPTYAAAGLFGAAHSTPYRTGGKFSAAEADYQGGTRPSAPAPGGEKAEGEEKPRSSLKPAAAAQEARAAESYAESAVAVQQWIQNAGGLRDATEEDKAMMALSPQELKSPENQRRFDSFVGRVRAAGNSMGAVGTKYDKAAGHIGRQEATPERMGFLSDKPLLFNEPGYRAGDDAAAWNRAAEKVDKAMPSGVMQNKKLTEMNDGELRAEHAALVQMQAIYQAGEMEPMERIEALQRNVGIASNTPAIQKIGADPKQIELGIEQVQRARALVINKPERNEGDITVTNAPPSRDESNEAKQRIEAYAASLDKAAEALGNQGRAADADALYAIAQQLHEAKPSVTSNRDVERVRDQIREDLDRVMPLIYQARKDNPGGSILG